MLTVDNFLCLPLAAVFSFCSHHSSLDDDDERKKKKKKKKRWVVELPFFDWQCLTRWRILELPKSNGEYLRRYLNSASKVDEERNETHTGHGHCSSDCDPSSNYILSVRGQFDGCASARFRPPPKNLASLLLTILRLYCYSRACFFLEMIHKR